MKQYLNLGSSSLALIVMFSGASSFAAFNPIPSQWNGKIMKVQTGETLTLSQLSQQLSDNPAQKVRNIVMGELHYNPPVQSAEGDIMRAVVTADSIQNQFTTAWEFLETDSDSKIQSLFQSFVNNLITGPALIQGIFGRDLETPYLPMLEVPKDLGGQLLSTNLSHAQKDPVVQGGLSAIDPSLIPPGFAMGGKSYFDRFAVAMQGHSTPAQLQNYFAAQCLTDDVIAYNLLQNETRATRFLVVGSFHTDYKDGLIARLEARAPNDLTTVIRWIDMSQFTVSQVTTDLPAMINDPKYGEIADYVYFVNEPTADPAPTP